jgi:SAM-dependent methyltransferase
MDGAADPIGFETMSPAMADMREYPRYLFHRAGAALGQRVWEIGVGNGQYTQWLLDRGSHVLGTDIDPQCIQGLQHRIQHRMSPQGILPATEFRTAIVDLNDRASVVAIHDFQADSILCLNVLEHIPDDVRSLGWMREALVDQGTLGIVVPAHPYLFGKMDREAGHYRRYTRRSLHQALHDSGWQILQLRYLNFVGAVGWWYHNRVRKEAGLGDAAVNRSMRTMDRWLPRLAKLTDPWMAWWGGLSVMAIARNTAASRS